ncbi:hypothetical protein [Ammoniphilus sp. CFH 90114]|uniref:hypothetical protein n=1 Tax=Ammoniphilus sp. CFH 90114 TaxID=2493665 RepID=UPI0010100844|nr:hypothetical protein [Ammoniphilus sp. CFH 90114]RXT13908.1 hypothetical protein EIZ39_07170 [Ammoniphilus sp. CFH 90114]
MFNLLFALLGTYIFYKRGLAFLLESRIMGNNKAESFSYYMFMLAGVILGEFIGLSAALYYLPDSMLAQVLIGTACAILCGESFYHYNKRVVRKIPTVQERKNY